MKKKILLAIVSVLLLIPMTVAQSAKAASITDFGTADATATKAWGTYKKYQYTENGNAQTLFYAEYKPTETSDYEFVVHSVRDSNGNTVLKTVDNIAKDFENKTGRKVKLATNGDYFSGTEPVDSMVVNGEVVKVGTFTNKNAFGFDNNGKVAIGRMTETQDVLQVALNGVDYRIDIDKKDTAPETGELALYTQAYNLSLPDTIKYKIAYDGTTDMVTDRPLDGQYKGNKSTADTLTLSAGQFALVTKGESKLATFLENALVYGAECKLINTPAGNFEGMEYVVGGYDILVNNGALQSSYHTDNGGSSNADRTMIGIKADGTMFLAVLDGRQSGYSVGCTVAEEAQLALAFGAKYALELDGGGSSTFMFDTGSGLTVLNNSSESGLRSVANAVLLVEKNKNAVTYKSLDDFDPENPNGDSDDTNGDIVWDLLAGCQGSVGGFGVIAAGCAVCVVSLQKKKKEKYDE